MICIVYFIHVVFSQRWFADSVQESCPQLTQQWSRSSYSLVTRCRNSSTGMQRSTRPWNQWNRSTLIIGNSFFVESSGLETINCVSSRRRAALLHGSWLMTELWINPHYDTPYTRPHVNWTVDWGGWYWAVCSLGYKYSRQCRRAEKWTGGYYTGAPRLLNVNADCTHFVDDIGNTVGLTPSPTLGWGSRLGRPSESHNLHTGHIVPLPFFPNPESFVSGDFTISPHCGWGRNRLFPCPLIHFTDSKSKKGGLVCWKVSDHSDGKLTPY